MPNDALFKRLKALIIFRAFFVTFLLGTFLIFKIGYYKFPFHSGIPYLIISLYAFSFLYAALLYKVSNLVAFGYVQLTIDAAATILLILFTGGIESWFSFVMLLSVIASVITMNEKTGYIVATLCSLLYGTMIDLQFYGVIPITFDYLVKQKDFLYNIFSHITALYLTAYLMGYLSSRLERTSKRLEEKDSDLKDLALFNEELIESLPSGLFTTDLSGTILIFNKAAEHITGVNRVHAAGKNISSLFPFITSVDETERAEGKISVGGVLRTMGLSVSASMDTAGNKMGYICIFQDITELKNMEEELKHKETLAAIGELSANMAHEIRNPLASLKGSIEILKEGALTKDHGEKLMNIAINEMDRLNKIITDFLTYSRPRQPEFFKFDLHAVLDETIDLLNNSIVNKEGITIRKDFEGPNEIVADSQKLRQVFLNLGMNAIESLQNGGQLTIGTKRVNDRVTIFFRDSGVGIPEENLKEIFYPFYTTKDKGTGLGLSIAYRIIEEHDGRIKVYSSRGRGTTFEVVIPILPSRLSGRDKTADAGLSRVGNP
jgi:two-component system sensor histidine kinase PilS (NtrC family)